jgi:GNAT superfamily N-acetyltransferase
MAAAAASDTDRALFAVNGGTVCGLVWCKLSVAEPGVADIYQMWVAPTARGLGAGRALLGQALAWAKSRGAQRVRLGVTVADSRPCSCTDHMVLPRWDSRSRCAQALP